MKVSNFGDRGARDRNRAVVRGRLRASYAFNKVLSAGAQVVTGDADDPNSSDVSLSNFNDDLDLSLDQLWLRGRWGLLELTAGKIPQPFVRTDMVWDSDVSPEGLSAAVTLPAESALELKASGLYFIVDESVGGPDSRMIGGQATANYKATDTVSGQLSLGYYDYRLSSLAGADAGDFRSNRLVNDRYLSDFNLLDLIATLQWSGLGPRWPIRLTGDYVHNFGADRGDTGLSVLTSIGRTVAAGDWRFGYGYSQVGSDAVFAAFSEDNTTIATNVLQHNLSIDYVLRPKLILNGSYYRYRAWKRIDAGNNDPSDWLNRLRINLLLEF
jgi:hypothetical protein